MAQEQTPSRASELEYYTDSEQLRAAFRQTITADLLPAQLFVVRGVGGIGKTELLRVFRRQCIDEGIAVGLASGHSDSERTGPAILDEWADDLALNGVEIQPFTKQRKQLAKLLLRVGQLEGPAGGQASKSMAGAFAATATGMVLPFAAPLASATLEAIVDRLRPDLKQDEIDLLLHPDERLTSAFVESVMNLTAERRAVLIIDALDRLGSVEFWLGDVARTLPSDSLLVVAGQRLPRWSSQHERDRPSGSQAWGWRKVAAIHEVTPLGDEDTRILVRAYHRFQMGDEPDERLVEHWTANSRGVPLNAAFAVDKGVDVEDQRVAESEALAEQRDYYLADIPKGLRPFVAATATVRHFDRSTLSAVYGEEVGTEDFNELTRKSYVKRFAVGDRIVFQLHDQMRDTFDGDLHLNDLDLDWEYHNVPQRTS